MRKLHKRIAGLGCIVGSETDSLEKDWRFPYKRSKNGADNSERIVGFGRIVGSGTDAPHVSGESVMKRLSGGAQPQCDPSCRRLFGPLFTIPKGYWSPFFHTKAAVRPLEPWARPDRRGGRRPGEVWRAACRSRGLSRLSWGVGACRY